ncbi:hypothetical protein R1flu_009369 [Riccia fluitans]|uniref:DNA mismatch repair protein n=1 Tax=Riccia fluitans TaxID=41844 RepID=A0ABD1Z4X4_9MARC
MWRESRAREAQDICRLVGRCCEELIVECCRRNAAKHGGCDFRLTELSRKLQKLLATYWYKCLPRNQVLVRQTHQLPLNNVPFIPSLRQALKLLKCPSPKKLPSEVQTPSPTEAPCPAQSVTKYFGRRGKHSVKARGTAAPPSLMESGNSGNGRGTHNPGESVIGMRLRVWWPLDKVWYPGRIRSYNKENGTHVIAYDDGEDETVTLSKEKLDWLDENEAVEGLQKLASGRSKRRGWNTDEDPSFNGKRKKGSEEQMAEEIPKHQADEGDGTPNKLTGKKKRSRMTAVEESPVKLTITGDVCDEVEMAMPSEEEVKVRRRLRKKVTPIMDEPKAEEVELLDVEDLEVATTLAEQKAKSSGDLGQRIGTSARRLLLEKVSGPLSTCSEDDEDSPRNETLADLASKKPTAKTEKSLSEQKSAKDFFTERLSGGRAHKNSMEKKSGSTSPLSDVRAEAPPEQPKLASMEKQSLREALTGGLKGVSSDERTEVRKSLQETEAERLRRGELHATLVGTSAARFLGRAEEKFKFLEIDRRDAHGKRPSDPDYDPRTVFLPQPFLKNLSGGQRQWWEFKAQHMDKVLLFKMGKFYEMFEMDAHIGAQELDLQYMKGEQPHCGFPEKNYAINAEKLAQKGYRVLVVEQTETPEQLEQRKRKTGAKDKVVRREVCGIITKGTIVDGEMLIARPDAAYLLSITERKSPSCGPPDDDPSNLSRDTTGSPEKVCTIGMCVVDTATSHIMLGQFYDDVARTRLRGLLSEIRPVEIIKPRGLLTEATERALKDHTRHPLVTALVPGKEFWEATRSLKEVMGIYFSLKSEESSSEKTQGNIAESELELREKYLPEALLQVVEADDLGEAAVSALGGAVFYLKQAILDQTVFRLGRIDLLPGSDSFNLGKANSREPTPACGEPAQAEGNTGRVVEPYMLMDAAALENLEVLENNRDGGVSGTLLGHLDYCVTPYGRRLLRQWLVRPLIRVDSIVKRQEAVCELKSIGAEAAASFRKELRSQPDMERLLSRLYAASDENGRNAQKVVLYEDAQKKLLLELLATLRGCRSLLQAVNSFETVVSKLSSSRLKQLISPDGGLSEMFEVVEHFEKAFDWNESESLGRVIPNAIEGIDPDVDEADATIKAVTEKLDDYLIKQRKKFGNFTEINYMHLNKEPYQIEIPDELHAKVPASYELRSSRKGYQRYWTPEIKELLQELSAGKEQKESSLQGILRSLVKRFCEHYHKWLCLIKSVAELDVLISLAEASDYTSPGCMPSLISAGSDSNFSSVPTISAKGLRHPTLRLSGGATVVPNDIGLGGGQSSFMLLTGPNMGGKSTLIRQVCLAVILAQVGAHVPAEHFELTPVDKMFVRMGARDHIMTGQSTFLVEMSETAAMLRGATRNSLVALDELGRGTSTADGQAIADAVMQHLVTEIGCRGMFSTHYHKLSSNFSTSDSRVGLYHMSCTVGTEPGGLEEVTFLYKLAPGPCPKSYGVNVARLAGIPEAVLKRAAERSAELESSWAEKDGIQTGVSADAPSDSSISDSEMLKDVSALIYRLLVEVDKNSSRNELVSAQEAVQKLLKVNKVDPM